MLQQRAHRDSRLASTATRGQDDRRPRAGAGAPPSSRRLHDATLVRSEADELLRRLLADRQSSEARLAEQGKADAIKAMTGISALERAIRDTRSMIREMDALIGDIRCELDEMAAVPLPLTSSP
jgi:hypothetical protein